MPQDLFFANLFYMSIRLYALTDSHQEARNLSVLLSYIYQCEKDSAREFLVLDCGDLFKGIYDKDLSVNAYIKLKKLLPNANIIITLGNNDFGFSKSDFEYLKSAIKKFNDNGIKIVCGNLYDSNYCFKSDLVSESEIIKINGKNILVSGFCLNNSCAKKFGCELISPQDAYEKLIENHKTESFDYKIILNHHWYSFSKDLKISSQEINSPIDLIIGGHEHSPIEPDYDNNIFYPLSFARTIYQMDLVDKIENIKQININDIKISSVFETPIKEFEDKSGIFKKICNRVLDLKKSYSQPCELGTFISDNMKAIAKTDIAFHSTGFTMYPLMLNKSGIITEYDLKRTICAPTPIVKMNLTIEQLKKVFENATKNRMYKNIGNSRFVQCSQNVKITGKGYPDKTYEIIQINIDGVDLLDKNSNPIDPSLEFSVAVDEYISNGEQGFEVLKSVKKDYVTDENGNKVLIDKLLRKALIEAQDKYCNSFYPKFQLIDM